MLDTIRPHQLATALDDAPEGLAMLSLDCFDTLIWRNIHAPTELFLDFGAEGPTRHQRVWAEGHARSRATLDDGRNETTIEQIYAALLPDESASDRALAVEGELALEASHCYAFAPTVALMHAAKRPGLPIAIVSDTYLSRAQLAALIAAAAGDDVLGLIDHIFCSSEYGVSKSEGLFKHVLRETGLAASRILHIGDNKAADFVAARALGINGQHLLQFGEADQQRFRLEAALGSIVNSAGPEEVPNPQPHRAAIALAAPAIDDPAVALGYSVLGPVLHGFARWIQDEAAALHRPGGRTHLLFLMRDGHLPRRVFEAMTPGGDTRAVEISRFTATAAGFTTERDIRQYLEIEVLSGDLEGIARQLLFEKAETATLLRKCGGRADRFAAAVATAANTAKIVTRSRAFAERLVAYVKAEVAPNLGDTLMLVDLGYNGTVQDRVEPLLSAAFGVQVAGRYLLLREQKMSRRDKAGFIDDRHYGANTLEALCTNVAVIEQLCTAAQGSVVDYDRSGRPVRSVNSIKGRQSDIRELVQQGCLRFAVERDAAFRRAPSSDGPETRRRAAASVLARLMFLPLPEELDVLARFDHDVNLGGEGTVKLFDPEDALRGLRSRGLFYMKGADRMFLPAELRGHGLSASLALFTQRRFGLDLKYADFCDRSVSLPLVIADGNQVDVAQVDAYPTHDGFMMAAIPIGAGRYSVGVQFGRLYEWVQVDSAQFVPVRSFLNDRSADKVEPVDAVPSLEGMEQVAPHLMRCEDEAAFMLVAPPRMPKPEPMMLTIVFRPIAPRAPESVAGPTHNASAGALR